MTSYQISQANFSQALGVSDTSSGLTWELDSPGVKLQSGLSPQFIRISNIGSTTAFVDISANPEIAVVPGSSVVGNTFPVAPNSSVNIQLFDQSGAANSVFNDGTGYCSISAITVEGTTILVFTPVQPV